MITLVAGKIVVCFLFPICELVLWLSLLGLVSLFLLVVTKMILLVYVVMILLVYVVMVYFVFV